MRRVTVFVNFKMALTTKKMRHVTVFVNFKMATLAVKTTKTLVADYEK